MGLRRASEMVEDRRAGQHGFSAWEWKSVYHYAVATCTVIQALDMAVSCLAESERPPSPAPYSCKIYCWWRKGIDRECTSSYWLPPTTVLPAVTVSFFLGAWSSTHTPNRTHKDCLYLWLCSTLCLHYHTCALVPALVIVVKLHARVQCCYASSWSCLFQGLKREAVWWLEKLKISLCCVLFTVGRRAGGHVTMTWIKCETQWGIRHYTKVKF
jgi:hypothetical protein